MYECFTKYLGIKACNEAEPINGLYINGSSGLAGLNLLSAGAIADEETQTGLELFKGCRQSAILETIADAKIELSKYFNFNRIIETRYLHPNTTYSNGNFSYITYLGNQYKYGKIELSEIVITSKGAETITLTIEEDEIPRTQSVDLVEGVNVITINAKAYYNLELSTTTSVEILSDGISFFRGTILYLCKDDAFWCAFAEELALAVRYKTGYLYMMEMLSSNRLNSDIQADMAKGNMALWYGTYNPNNGKFEGGEYQKYLNSAIQTIKASLEQSNDYCINCSQIKHVYARP